MGFKWGEGVKRNFWRIKKIVLSLLSYFDALYYPVCMGIFDIFSEINFNLWGGGERV